MKKAISLLLALVMCLSLCACGSQADIQDETDTAPTIVESISPTIMETEQQINSAWELDYLVDEFGDKTDKTYIKCRVEGNFSNTATMNSHLTVVVFFEPGASNDENMSLLSFRLLEYGDHPATYLSSDEMTMKIKIGDDIFTQKLHGIEPNGDVALSNGDVFDTLIRALPAGEQEVRCIIEIGSSKYTFSIHDNGYVDSFNEMMRTYGFSNYDVRDALKNGYSK